MPSLERALHIAGLALHEGRGGGEQFWLIGHKQSKWTLADFSTKRMYWMDID